MSKLMFDDFACDNCGACCESLIIEAAYYDAMREPKLYAVDTRVDRRMLKTGEQSIILYDRESKACPFLDGQTKLFGI